jgi:hypothetical protein
MIDMLIPILCCLGSFAFGLVLNARFAVRRGREEERAAILTYVRQCFDLNTSPVLTAFAIQIASGRHSGSLTMRDRDGAP